MRIKTTRQQHRRLQHRLPIIVRINSRANTRDRLRYLTARKRGLWPFIQPINYTIGDYVTRGGDDVQLVTYLSDDKFSGTFVCVVAPASAWCAVGDVEYNLCRRYAKVEHEAV